MKGWESIDMIEAGRGDSFSIGRASPVLLIGIMLVIAPWILDLVMPISGFVKGLMNVLGIFLILAGAVLSMVDR